MVTKYEALCYSILGKYVRPYKSLEQQIKKSRMKTPPELYLSYVWFTSLIMLIPGIAIVAIYILFTSALGIQAPLAVTLLVALSPILLMIMTYAVLISMPSMKARSRAKDIEKNLPSALEFISAMASAGVNPDAVFKSLAEQEIYGEVAHEADWIARDVSVLGLDIITALRSAIERTPSVKFSDFLQGAITIINSGGNLKGYFLTKSEQFMRERKQVEKNFLETLAVMAEAYVTVAVATPLFLIIIISVMMMIGGGSGAASSKMFVYIIIFAILPIIHFAFLVIMSVMNDEVNVQGKKQPFKFELDSAIVLSAVLVIFIAILMSMYPEYVFDLAVVMLLAAIGPYGFKRQAAHRKSQKIEDRFPEFLNDLAESRKAGMTFTTAIKTISKGDYEMLTPEVKKMATQISWSVSFTDALKMLGNRLRIPTVERYVSLIIGANNAGGSVSDVISSAAEDARVSKMIRSERRSNMSIYIMVIYISFFVFLTVIAVLYGAFVPQLAGGTTDGAAGLGFSSAIPAEEFWLLYFAAVVIQGVGNGFVGGMMSEGNMFSGMRHVFVMVLIAYVAFKFFI